MVIVRMTITWLLSMKTIEQLQTELAYHEERKQVLLSEYHSVAGKFSDIVEQIKQIEAEIFQQNVARFSTFEEKIPLMLKHSDSNYEAAKTFFQSMPLSTWVAFTGSYLPEVEQWSIRVMLDDDSKDKLTDIAEYIDTLIPHIAVRDGQRSLKLFEPSLSYRESYQLAKKEDGKWELQGSRYGTRTIRKFSDTISMLQYLQYNYSFKKD